MRRRIVYVQYTNPGAYPPLDHSSQLLADKGWDVLFLATGAFGADALQLAPHERIVVKRLPFRAGGIWLKIAYLRYMLWVLLWIARWRPSWVYASDSLSCPVALLACALGRVRLIYHEHDAPSGASRSRGQRLCLWARGLVARQARLCVLPTEQRRAAFALQTGARSTVCVWNCPTRSEVGPARIARAREGLTVLFQGAITPPNLPRAVVQALPLLPDTARLQIIGYETVGSRGYLDELLRLAQAAGVSERIEVLGAMPRRAMLELASGSDVGLALTPWKGDNVNWVFRVGASNKPFDYLTRGLAVIVADVPEWTETYVQPGYGLAVDPDSPESIAAAFRWLLEHPGETREMGERGRQQILLEWNYERTFEPVLRFLDGAGAGPHDPLAPECSGPSAC